MIKYIVPRPGIIQLANSPDLNQGPSDLQSDALPTELSRQLAFDEMKYNLFFIYDIYIICCSLLEYV